MGLRLSGMGFQPHVLYMVHVSLIYLKVWASANHGTGVHSKAAVSFFKRISKEKKCVPSLP